MRRREFLGLSRIGGLWVLVAWSRSAIAQTATPRKVGVLRVNPENNEIFADQFRRDMVALGWDDGRNIRFEFRWAGGDNQALPKLAEELARQEVDAIVTFGIAGSRAAQRASRRIPIIAMADDLVVSGLAESMARPGGNTTGISVLVSELDIKRLELLHEALPEARRIAALADPSMNRDLHHAELKNAAGKLGIDLAVFEAETGQHVARALDALIEKRVEAVNVLASPMLNGARADIVGRLNRARIPAIFEWPETAQEGGFMGYGPRIASVYRQVAILVDKILRGAKPTDLPIAQPTEFALVVNLSTAKALGIALPQSFLLRADEVIE